MTRQFALDFHEGVCFWWRGWSFLLRHRKLFALAILPLLISLIAAIVLVWTLWTYLPAWTLGLVAWTGLSASWMQSALYYPLLFSGGILVLLASVYVVYVSQSFVAVPFFSALADRTLARLNKKPDDDRSWKEWTRHTVRMLRVSLLKSLALLALGFCLFVFSFLPVLNLISLAGAMMVLAFDCMDYSLEALGLGFRRRIRYMRRHLAQWLGMSLGLALTLLVPGLTLLIIPGAIVGAAMVVKSESL